VPGGARDISNDAALRSKPALPLEAEGRSVWLTDHFPCPRSRQVLPGRGRFCPQLRSAGHR